MQGNIHHYNKKRILKAVVYKKYGPPEVVTLMDVSKPIPKNNEVLIKVYVSSVNRTDAGFRSAQYFISRLWSGLIRPKHQILGCAFAGVIEDMGKMVTTYKKGTAYLASMIKPLVDTQNF